MRGRRGGLVPHPMEVEGAVAGFTPFHNTNCPQASIRASSKDCIMLFLCSWRHPTCQLAIVLFAIVKFAKQL